MVVTVTNNTEETVFDICTVYALLDAEGNILYMNDYSTYSMGLAAGSSMIIQELIPSEFSDYFAANNLVPASVDAIAYTEVENEQ